MLSPFVIPTPLTAAQRLAMLQAAVAQGGSGLLNIYMRVQALATPDVLAIMASADQQMLQNYAAIVKGCLNAVAPGTITDSVVAATITLPQ